ncbi:hypothetical protein F5888DRAFT_1871862 [Russula emetica]|nr:hypothetical protein F5888DRAFT_1871862 [Russula emetica]
MSTPPPQMLLYCLGLLFTHGAPPLTAFLNRFLPPPSDPSSVPQFPTGLFNDFIKSLSQTESASYDKFIEAISPHVPSLIIVNTSCSSDKAPHGKFHLKLKPDCSVDMHGERTKDDLDLSRVDFVIEMKSEADPFVLKVPSNPRDHTSNSGDDLNSFLHLTSGSRSNLGQITAYAMAIMSAQYRTHTFSVLIMKDYARLIQWDRSGAVVTEPIYYNSQPHLFDFLVRYGIADSEVRGHDSTVHSSSTLEEIALARAIVPELKDVESFLVLTIPDDSDRPSERRYIIYSPEPRPDIPVGRWTRSLFTLDVKERRCVLVKDSWRVLLKDIKPEGELYDLLHWGKVDNIPSCLSAGDVGADIYHQTQTHKVGNDMNYKLTPHRHYRIVLGTIGRKLEEFKCTREFVNAMYAALKAHKAAHDIGILHRDISPGNILIACDDELDHNDPHESKIQGGLLIDWDLSKVIDRDDEHSGSTARQQTRTGTWQFMAAELIERPKIRHTFSHDLESFFWVLMWIVVTRVPTTWDESTRSIFINGVMNPKVYSNIGSTEKSTWLKAGNPLREKGFQIRDNPILHKLAMELYDSVAGQYCPRPSDQAPPTKLNPYILSGRILCKNPEEEDKNYEIGLTFLKDYDTLLKQFEQALNAEWPSNDKASLQSIARSNASIHFYSQSQSKRLRPVADEGGPFNKYDVIQSNPIWVFLSHESRDSIERTRLNLNRQDYKSTTPHFHFESFAQCLVTDPQSNVNVMDVIYLVILVISRGVPATTTQLNAVANAKEFDLQGKDGDDEISDTSGPPNPLSELEPQNTGSQQADPLNGPVDVIATLDLLYFFTGIEQPTQGGPIILKQGPPPPKVCKLCSEKYGFDKSMLPGVARYIYGPTTANTNLRRHLYQAHAEEYDKAVLEYKWTYKLLSEVGNASTHTARASCSCR